MKHLSTAHLIRASRLSLAVVGCRYAGAKLIQYRFLLRDWHKEGPSAVVAEFNKLREARCYRRQIRWWWWPQRCTPLLCVP